MSFELSDLVESSGYSSKTLGKGSYPYAPLDGGLRYVLNKCFISTALCTCTTNLIYPNRLNKRKFYSI